MEEVHPDLEDSLKFLNNVYDLHHTHHYVYISYHEVEHVEMAGIVTKEQGVVVDDKIVTEDVTSVAEEVRQTKKDSNNAREITEGEEIKEKVEEVQMKEDEKGYPEVRMKSENIKLLSIKLADKNRECDLLGKRMFEMTQEMKITTDRMKQLEENNYQTRVVILEEVVEEK